MNTVAIRMGLAGLVAIAAMGLGGCKNTVKEENAALREENAKLLAQNDETKTKMTDSEARRAELEGKLSSKDAEIARLQGELATKPVPPSGWDGGTTRTKTGGTGGSERIVVAGDVLFGSGSASLSTAGKRELDKVAANIRSKHPGDTIRVEGYTDSDPIRKSSYGSNQALSQARAEAVEKYLASKGISASRITAVGMGAANPKATKSASRRVEIVIVDTN